MFKALNNIVDLVVGDSRKPEQSARAPQVPMLSHYLGYRSFDEDKRIFHQVRSKGFILELAPLVGANDRVNDMIGQIFSDILMPGSKFSVTNYSSPRVAEKLQAWALPRYKASGVFQTLAKHRIDKLRNGAWSTLASDGPFFVRNFRVVMSVGISEGSSLSTEDLLTMRDGIVSALESIDVPVKEFEPTDLIRLFDEILAPSTGAGDEVPGYNRFDPINEQCVRRDLVTHVEKDRLILHAQSLRPTGATVEGVPEMKDFVPERFDIRTMAVRNFPDRWAPWDTQKVIGDIFNPKLNLPCPVLQTVCGIIPGQESSEAKAGYKFARTSSLAEGKGVKLVPKLRTEASEWEFVQDRVKQGEKLVSCYYAVSILSPKGRGEPCERTLKALYKASGWDLIDETHIQLPAFMSHFPLMLADGLDSDYKRMKRLRTMRSANVAAIAPIQGEFVGGNIPHLLFIGRSFEHMAKALGGTFTEFKLSSGISINPFRMIDDELAQGDDDYLVDCLAMLKSIISQMARNETRLNDTERGLIDQAVNTVWEAHGRDGTVDHIIDALKQAEHPFAYDLATSLLPFAARGTFGRFFLGDANLDLSADLTVFELSDLATREELRGVVLTSIMFIASQVMRRMDRSIPKPLIIDEAWQMLKGGAMADFVETYSRTCRKYGGSLITATQSIHDYYKSEGSRAALENSDWFLILQQKGETISDFRNSDRFEMDNMTEALLRSLKRNGIDYSDIFIRGPETESIGRLVLDRYSGTLYSSSPDVFAQTEDYVHRGYSVPEAIEAVAFPDENQLLEAAE